MKKTSKVRRGGEEFTRKWWETEGMHDRRFENWQKDQTQKQLREQGLKDLKDRAEAARLARRYPKKPEAAKEAPKEAPKEESRRLIPGAVGLLGQKGPLTVKGARRRRRRHTRRRR